MLKSVFLLLTDVLTAWAVVGTNGVIVHVTKSGSIQTVLTATFLLWCLLMQLSTRFRISKDFGTGKGSNSGWFPGRQLDHSILFDKAEVSSTAQGYFPHLFWEILIHGDHYINRYQGQNLTVNIVWCMRGPIGEADFYLLTSYIVLQSNQSDLA